MDLVQTDLGPELPAAGKCQYCGCTDDDVCLLGLFSDQLVCRWVNDEHTICSNPECVAARGASK